MNPVFDLLCCLPPNEEQVLLSDVADDLGVKYQSAVAYAYKAIQQGYELVVVGKGQGKRVYAKSCGYNKLRQHAERYWEEMNDGQQQD